MLHCPGAVGVHVCFGGAAAAHVANRGFWPGCGNRKPVASARAPRTYVAQHHRNYPPLTIQRQMKSSAQYAKLCATPWPVHGSAPTVLPWIRMHAVDTPRPAHNGASTAHQRHSHCTPRTAHQGRLGIVRRKRTNCKAASTLHDAADVARRRDNGFDNGFDAVRTARPAHGSAPRAARCWGRPRRRTTA